MRHSSCCRIALLGGLCLVLGAASRLRAEGSPPLITDDPGTPGAGHWEINVGLSTEKRPGSRLSELPLVDLNYGIGERLQLNYEVPYLRLSGAGGPAVAGPGNSAAGVKWRFYDAGGAGPACSVFPKVEFNNPGSTSADRGLVDHGASFRLPVQFAREAGPLQLVAQIGREFRRAGDAWFFGASAGHRLGAKVELALELAGGADPGFHRSHLTANLGVAVDLGERTSFLFSIGRELHNHDEPRATFVGYVGMQWRL